MASVAAVPPKTMVSAFNVAAPSSPAAAPVRLNVPLVIANLPISKVAAPLEAAPEMAKPLSAVSKFKVIDTLSPFTLAALELAPLM